MSTQYYLRWAPILLQSLWDVAVVIEGITLLGDLKVDFALEYIINFLALNWQILLLRFALWRSGYTGIEYIMIFSGLGWSILQTFGFLEDATTCGDGTDSYFNSLQAQLIYYGVAVLCGVLVVLLDFWESPGCVTITTWNGNIWVGGDTWRTFGEGQLISDEPMSSPKCRFTLKRSRMEAFIRFLRRQKYSKKRQTSRFVAGI